MAQFSNWMQQQFNIDSNDFKGLGDVVLSNIKLTPDDGDGEPVEYKSPSKFKITSNKDGSIVKLTDTNIQDTQNRNKAEFPNTTKSPEAGRTYTMSRKEYEKLLLFPSQPQQPMGM